MKQKSKPLYAVLLIMVLNSCTAPSGFENVNDKTGIHLQFEDLDLFLHDKDSEDFIIEKRGTDTIVVSSKDYMNLTNTKVSAASRSELKDLRCHERSIIQAIQSTIDDNPASDLGLRFPVERNLDKIENSFLINEQTHFQNAVKTNHLAKIKVASLKKQTDFYRLIVLEKYFEEFKECCPEYIEQANQFLENPPLNATNFSELRVAADVWQSTHTFSYKLGEKEKKIVLFYRSEYPYEAEIVEEAEEPIEYSEEFQHFQGNWTFTVKNSSFNEIDSIVEKSSFKYTFQINNPEQILIESELLESEPYLYGYSSLDIVGYSPTILNDTMFIHAREVLTGKVHFPLDLDFEAKPIFKIFRVNNKYYASSDEVHLSMDKNTYLLERME